MGDNVSQWVSDMKVGDVISDPRGGYTVTVTWVFDQGGKDAATAKNTNPKKDVRKKRWGW